MSYLLETLEKSVSKLIFVGNFFFLDCAMGLVLEKEMATHSSVLAWRIPGTGEPGELPSVGSHRVGHE